MKSIRNSSKDSKQGFMLFLVLGVVSVMSLAALIAMTSARLEARTAHNHYHSVRALYHAEAGVKLVKMEVERRLDLGESLSTILNSLSVTAPEGVTFETINQFKTIVPERLFSFESVGTSDDARASVVVQYRRRPVVTIGLFGDIHFSAQNHTSIYGYDSRINSTPTPADNNGGASMGSNGSITLGNNNFSFYGSLLLGETGDGLIASCTRCDDFTQAHIGYIDPDPMGLNSGGTLASTFTDKMSNNNNNNSNGLITNNQLEVPNHSTVTLPAGDYYLTDFHMNPGSTLILDNTSGPVRLFLDGDFRMQPNGNTILNQSGSPTDFQIFSKSSNDMRIQPANSLPAYIYAPNAHVRMQPNGDFFGNVWSKEIQIQPAGDIYVDTSIADSMMLNSLEIHAWYEQQGF